MNDSGTSSKRPVWREPMIWLVVALPVMAVIGGIAMLVISTRAGNTDAVADKVQRTAQIQTSDLGPDERARQLALRAVVRVTPKRVQVFAAGGTFPKDAPLHLTLLHPNRSEEDRTLVLKRDALGWSSALELDTSHDWKLQLADPQHGWRLQGRLPRGQQAAVLESSLTSQ